MISRRGRRWATLAILCASAAAASGFAHPAPPVPQDQDPAGWTRTGQLPHHEAFGFQLGEQRRYALGPPRVLKAGEFEMWTLRLDEINRESSGMPLYTFTYSRELSLIDPGDPEHMYDLQAQMSVTLNQYGFPVDIRYGGGGEDSFDTDFVNKHGRLRWLGSAYLFRAPNGAEERSFSFGLPEHDALERAIPAGVFISETENPALITFPAAVFQAIGAREMEYLALRPNRIGAQQMRRDDRSRSRNRRTDLVRSKLEFEDVEEIELGGRTYEAIRLDSSESNDDVFIRADGALLRLDTDFRNWRNAYIRLLHPSEY